MTTRLKPHNPATVDHPPESPYDQASMLAQPELSLSSRRRIAAWFGARWTGQGLLFVQPSWCIKGIRVIGDFNQWDRQADRLIYNPRLGVWSCCIDVPRVTYRYKLIVDDRVMLDPHNPLVVTDAAGEQVNMVHPSRPTHHAFETSP